MGRCFICLEEINSGGFKFPCGHEMHAFCACKYVVHYPFRLWMDGKEQLGNPITCPACRRIPQYSNRDEIDMIPIIDCTLDEKRQIKDFFNEQLWAFLERNCACPYVFYKYYHITTVRDLRTFPIFNALFVQNGEPVQIILGHEMPFMTLL